MTADELYGALEDLFDEMDDSDVVDLWNRYAYENGYEMIHYMDDFNEIIEEQYSFTPFELVDAAVDWDPQAEYFIVDDKELIRCFSDLAGSEFSPLDRNALINAIIDTENDFDNDEVAELLEEFEREE